MALHEFTMEGRVVRFETARLKVHIIPMLNDYFGKHLYNRDFTEGGSEIKRGQIEQIVLYHGNHKLTVGGERIKIDGARPARSVPDLWSDDGMENLYEAMLKAITEDNPWLYKKQPYSAVFNLYAPDEDSEDEDLDSDDAASETEDPTVPAPARRTAAASGEAGSTNGSTFTTDTGEDLTEESFEGSTEITVLHE